VLIGVVMVCEVVTFRLYYRFAQATATGPGIPWRFAARSNLPQLVSAPPLQGTSADPNYGPSEVAALREKEEALLSAYGPAPGGAPDRVHIPVSQAMKLLCERGLQLEEEEQ
jgi:hypothetical protein